MYDKNRITLPHARKIFEVYFQDLNIREPDFFRPESNLVNISFKYSFLY